MNWKERHRSFYYKHAEQPNDISLLRCDTAHLIIDVQKTYLDEKPNSTENKENFIDNNTNHDTVEHQ